jgi:signal transduction histidine kinase
MTNSLEISGEPFAALFSSHGGHYTVACRSGLGAGPIVESLVESAPHPVLIVDCGLDVIAANSRARDMLSMGDAAVPSPAWRYLGKAAVERIERVFSSSANASTASFRVHITKADGVKDINVMAARLTDAARRTLGVTLSLAETLWDMPHSAVCRPERVEALGLYTAGIVHEFNGLLTVISGRAGLGLMANGPAAKDRALDNVLAAARRAEHITKNLLTYVQRREPQFVLADLSRPVAEAVSLLEIELAAARITVVRDFEKMPLVTCDPVQISQVCFNVLRNAREAMTDGGTITVTLRKSSSWAVITIADTGRGIPMEMQSRIFDPFVSYGAAHSCKPSGTGLGLFIAKEIILAHGGDISIESVVAKGSAFTIRIPLSRR